MRASADFIKGSLRAKVTLAIFLAGFIPIAGASVFFYQTAKDALFRNVFRELKWNVNEISAHIEDHFASAAKDLVIASRNTAFAMYYLDPANRGYWLGEEKKTLRHLRSLYPDTLDEACFISSGGTEIARIVMDRVSREDELSSGEDRAAFFREALLMNDGEVYQGRPVISEDTKRWVIPNATPIFVQGKKTAILHFEISMGYFRSLLKKSINPDRGFGFILSGDGEFLAHTRADMGESAPFPRAIADGAPPALRGIYERMARGESGIEQYSDNGRDYYIVYKPIATGISKGRNDNRWSIAYVIPGEKVYVELSIIRYNAFFLVVMLSAVVAIAYMAGKRVTMPIVGLAEAAKKVAAGEMPKVEVTGADEIGTLSRSFNTMIQAITMRDAELKALATTDGLTGLYNYRYFMAALEKELKGALRYSRPLSFVMVDVDYFKHYNDRNGHPSGDAALMRLAGILLKNAREVDLVARYGGEEFAIILPETGLEEAVAVAERMRARVEAEDVPYEDAQPNGAFTISLGAASLGEGVKDMDSLILVADKNLYRAKELGRNRVFPEPAPGKR